MYESDVIVTQSSFPYQDGDFCDVEISRSELLLD